EARQDVNQCQAAGNRNTGMASAVGREADGVEGAADRGPLQQDPEADDHGDKQRQLCGDAASEVALPEELEGLGDVEAYGTSASHSFTEAAKKRVRSERD